MSLDFEPIVKRQESGKWNDAPLIRARAVVHDVDLPIFDWRCRTPMLQSNSPCRSRRARRINL